MSEFKNVPVEPTDEMWTAGAKVVRFDTTILNKMWMVRAAYKAMLDAAPTQPSPAESDKEAKVNVTLDGCLETLFRIEDHLGINYTAARRADGAPSDVYITAIESVRNAALDEAIDACLKVVASKDAERFMGKSAHYEACADAISALKSQPSQPSDTEIAEAFQDAIDAYPDPNQSWGISREYAIAAVRSIKADMQAQEGS